MTARTDSGPGLQGGVAVSRQASSAFSPGSRADEHTAANVRARTDRDLELMAQVAVGDIDATELLAERMAPRALRVARSLMVGTDDAGDAALHALIELLRSHARYRGQLRLERWADRVMALSVVRFARAVRRRDKPALAPSESARADSDGAPSPEHAPSRVDERGARTFELYLALLPEQSRQILLLRHGLAFALGELSEALQCSLPVAREQLRGARRDMRSLVRRKSNGGAAELGPGAQRWCALRDREALGESLAPDEHEELTRLETRDPEVWAFVAQVRALELFFDAAREAPQSGAEHELAARSVAALEVTSPTLRTRAQALAPATDTGPDFEGSRWVRRVAVAASIALAAASALALWLYDPPAPAAFDPRSVRAPALSNAERADAVVRAAALGATDAIALKPTVEALPTVRTALRGAKLRRAGRVLPEGTLLAQGDLVETSDRPGCLQFAPDTELCLAPMTQLKLSSLLPRARRIELLAGRVVARIGPLSETSQWSVRADQVEIQAARAVFSAERLPDGKLLRVRTLRAGVQVHVGQLGVPVDEARSATARLAAGPVDVVALFPAQAQRDWELLATGLYPAASAVPALAKSAGPPAGTGAVAPRLGEFTALRARAEPGVVTPAVGEDSAASADPRDAVPGPAVPSDSTLLDAVGARGPLQAPVPPSQPTQPAAPGAQRASGEPAASATDLSARGEGPRGSAPAGEASAAAEAPATALPAQPSAEPPAQPPAASPP